MPFEKLSAGEFEEIDHGHPPEEKVREMVKLLLDGPVHPEGVLEFVRMQFDRFETARVYVREPVSLVGVELSVAVTVTVEFPEVVGVPLSTPVALFRLRSGGKPVAVQV